jgi:archaellum component FlaC
MDINPEDQNLVTLFFMIEELKKDIRDIKEELENLTTRVVSVEYRPMFR